MWKYLSQNKYWAIIELLKRAIEPTINEVRMTKLWLVLAMSFISSGAFAVVTCEGACTVSMYCYDAQGNESRPNASGTSKSDGSGGCYCDTGNWLCPGANGAGSVKPRALKSRPKN